MSVSEKHTKTSTFGWGPIGKVTVVGATLGLVAGLALPGVANATSDDVTATSAAATASTVETAAKTRPGAIRNGGFIVRLGDEKAGQDLNVSVRLKDKKKGVRVFLDREIVGGDKTIARKTSRAKGRVNFTIPGKYVSATPRAFTVTAGGVKASTFVVRVSPPGSSIVGAVPGKVSGLRGTPYDDMAAMQWNPRPDATEGYILQYQENGDGDVWNTINTDNTKYDVKNLSNGIKYNFRVAAVNADGPGPWSTVVAITPAYNPPAEVENLTATPVDSSVTLRWDRSTLASSYVIQMTCAENTDFNKDVCFVDKRTQTGTSIAWGGLVNDKTYLFGVTPVGIDGDGVRATITAEPKPKPTQPKNLNIEPGNAAVYLQWSAVANATEYRAYYKPDNGAAEYGPWVTDTFTSVTGLVNDQPYTIGVQTRNAYGTMFGPSDTGITPTADAPGGIDALAALPGDASVTLSWSPVDGADDYAVHYRKIGAAAPLSDPVPFLDSDPTDDYITMTVPGLENGEEYEFFVWAENLYGRGPADTVNAAPNGVAVAAADITVAALPAPGNLNVTPRDSSLRASWSAVAGAAGYLVYYSTNQQNWTFDDTYTGRSATINGLDNGTPYWVQVTAYDASGPGEPATDGPETPVARPDSVDNFRGYASNGAVQLSWAPTEFADTYLIRSQNPAGQWSGYTTVTAPATTYRVEGLNNGDGYTFEIRARNAVGTGTPITTGPITPSDQVPAVVTDATGVAGDGEVTLTWTPPANATGYKIITQLADTQETFAVDVPAVDTVSNDGASKITHTVANLTNGTAYNFYIFSVNQYGWSAPATVGPLTPVDVIIPPDPPTITSVTPFNSSLQTAFTLGEPGSAAFDYLEYSTANGAEGTWQQAASLDSPLNIAELTNGQRYEIVLRVTNKDGATSPPSNMMPGTPIAAPAKPKINTIDELDSALTINFDAPSSAAAPVQKVYYSVNNGSSWTQADDTASPINVTGLTNGQTYQVVVRSWNTSGQTDSDMKEATPRADIEKPYDPIIGSIRVGEQTVDGQLEVNYFLTVDETHPIDELVWTAVTDDSAPVGSGSLTPRESGTYRFNINAADFLGEVVNVTITATNPAGTGTDTDNGTPIGKPVDPTITSIVFDSPTSATVNYTAPTSAARPANSVTYTLDGAAPRTAKDGVVKLTDLSDDTHTIYISSGNVVGYVNSNTESFRYVPVATVPEAPTLTAAVKSGQTGGSISWELNGNGGAAIDYVQYNLNGGAYVTIPNSGAGGVTSYAISGLTANTTYTVTVKAHNSVGLSPASNALTFTTDPVPPPPPPTPTNPSAPTCTWVGVDVNSVTVKCDRNPNGYAPTGFNIGGVNVAGGTTATATINGLPADTLKTVTAYAYNGGGNSTSVTVQTATNPNGPTVTLSGPITQPGGPGTNRCAPLKWDNTAVSGQYALNVNGNWWGLGPSINGTTFQFCDAAANTGYEFKVAGVNQLTKNATWTTVKLGPPGTGPNVGAVPPIPSISGQGVMSTEAEGGKISVTATSAGAISTQSQIVRNGAVAPFNSLSITDQGLAFNTNYQYKATGCNANGCSAFSTWYTFKTGPGLPIWDVKKSTTTDPKTKIDFNSLGLNGTGAKSFRIKWCSQAQYGTNCDPFSQGDSTGWITDTGAFTRTIGGLTPGTGYRFGVVTASDTSGGNPITKSNVQRAVTGG